MTEEEALDLLKRYETGQCTAAERELVASWYNQLAATGEAPSGDFAGDKERVWADLSVSLRHRKERAPLHLLRYAAIALLCCVVAGYALIKRTDATNEAERVVPGHAGATLTLANGKVIDLNGVQQQEVAREGGISIAAHGPGKIIYLKGNTAGVNGWNTLRTSLGESFEVVLPDSTHIWLNAGSSLSYFNRLIEHGQRMVKLSGEAYFEVKKDKRHPFIVTTRTQRIEVLGTHFNVSAYDTDETNTTTLLEGSVQLNASVTLQPGQQAQVAGQQAIKVRTVDTESVVAWKNNKFIFNTEPLSSVLQKLSRWYNVEVLYQGIDPESLTFSASISRHDDIRKIITMINYTETVTLKLEGRRLVVMP